MTDLKIKKQRYDEVNFINLADTIENINEYAIMLHHRLVAATNLIKKDSENIDSFEIKKLLNDYPSIYSWATIEHRLVAQKATIIRETLDDKMREYFHEYSLKAGEKTTQKAIDAAIYNDHKEEINLFKKDIRDLDTKTSILKDLVGVWESTGHTLQAMARQINSELEMTKLKLRG